MNAERTYGDMTLNQALGCVGVDNSVTIRALASHVRELLSAPAAPRERETFEDGIEAAAGLVEATPPVVRHIRLAAAIRALGGK